MVCEACLGHLWPVCMSSTASAVAADIIREIWETDLCDKIFQRLEPLSKDLRGTGTPTFCAAPAMQKKVRTLMCSKREPTSARNVRPEMCDQAANQGMMSVSLADSLLGDSMGHGISAWGPWRWREKKAGSAKAAFKMHPTSEP